MANIPGKAFIYKEQVYLFSILQLVEMVAAAEAILAVSVLVQVVRVAEHGDVNILDLGQQGAHWVGQGDVVHLWCS